MFRECTTAIEVEYLYKRLFLRLHPDHGGCEELMDLLRRARHASIHFPRAQNESLKKSDRIHMQDLKIQGKGKLIHLSEDESSIDLGDERLDFTQTLEGLYEDNDLKEPEFLSSVMSQLHKYGKISRAQYNSLINIYNNIV